MGPFTVPPPPPSNHPHRDPMADSNAATPWGPSNGTQVGMGGWGPQGEIWGGRVYGQSGGATGGVGV